VLIKQFCEVRFRVAMDVPVGGGGYSVYLVIRATGIHGGQASPYNSALRMFARADAVVCLCTMSCYNNKTRHTREKGGGA